MSGGGNLTSQITQALTEYSRVAQEDIQKILDDVGKEAVQKVKPNSPKGTGKYRRGWKVTVKKRPDHYEIHVHNKRYQLTHLLEKGHKIWRGGRAAAFPHIADVDNWAKEEAERRIREALSR